MTEQELDRMMRQVLLDSFSMDAVDADENIPPFQPSPRHRRQIRAMRANPLGWAHNRARPLWRRVLRRAAMFALAAFLGLGVTLAVSPTARAAVRNWVVELYDTLIIYRYSGEPTHEGMPLYQITALPEGFVEVERYCLPDDEMPVEIGFTYKNEVEDVIYFAYSFIQQGGAALFFTENTDVSEVMINGMRGQYFESNILGNLNSITWIDEEINVQFMLDGNFSKDVILHMAESVSLCKTTN